MRNLTSTLAAWLPLSAAIVTLSLTVYVTVQQNIRLTANEVPARYARELKEQLEKGISPQQAVSAMGQSDMLTSESPFMMICDTNGSTLYTTATLHGRKPVIPAGVFAVAKARNGNRRTWEPTGSVRNAIVVLPYSINGEEGFVVGGQSLREADDRVRIIFMNTALGAIASLFVTFVITFIIQLFITRTKQFAQ